MAENDSVAASILEKYYHRPEYELYDLQNDPTEQNNLIANPDYKPEFRKYKDLLQEWTNDQGDKLKVYNQPYLRSEGIPTAKTIEQRRRD